MHKVGIKRCKVTPQDTMLQIQQKMCNNFFLHYLNFLLMTTLCSQYHLQRNYIKTSQN